MNLDYVLGLVGIVAGVDLGGALVRRIPSACGQERHVRFQRRIPIPILVFAVAVTLTVLSRAYPPG